MKTLAFALAMTSGCVAMSAQATTPVQNVQERAISYDGSNLHSDYEAGMLLIRIQTAARRVCGLANPGLMAPYMRDQLQKCVEESTARAIADVDAPSLTRRAINLGVIETSTRL